eukprot:TRINITY_DN36245_c0_g1_i1.p1 TRINITY_DN36245_c0_g1~~TRINITY_DN36245_c0_g1_i1.p1  ORF type:complete len:259 (-),score=29.84 TRINITY_DN36245_c0_g1_i1:148-924(-)
MVTFSSVQRTCCSCNKSNDQDEICSYTTFGSPDLDLRPPPMKRGTMSRWVEECPHCNYCGTSTEDLPAELPLEETKAVMASTEYQQQTKVGSLASRFLRQALLATKLVTTSSGLVVGIVCVKGKEVPAELVSIVAEYAQPATARDPSTAFWAFLRAAWCFDDQAEGDQSSIDCRKQALRVLQTCGQQALKDADTRCALEVDLLRRCQDWSGAKQSAENALQRVDAGIMKSILNFQLSLVEKKDAGCYKCSDASKDEEE